MIEQVNEMYLICNIDNGRVKLVRGDENLAPNFKVYEFRSPDSKVILYSQRHINLLQAVRDYYEKSVKITSGFRTIKENDRVNGDNHSFHMNGKASDIVVAGEPSREVKKVVSKIFGYDSQIITYMKTNHVHVASGCKHQRLFYSNGRYEVVKF